MSRRRSELELASARAQLVRCAEDIRELYGSYLATMETLAHLVEAKDAGTGRHLDRTSRHALALARLVDPDLAERPQLVHGFRLHDIGKVAIPEAILTKPGPLRESEWARMRTHPVVGADIVAPITFLGEAVDVIRFHHERFDGSGYPDGLSGEKIPLSARIFAVADAFDAMTSDRPYRSAIPAARALDEIAGCSGSHFDPEVVEAFLRMVEARPAVTVTDRPTAPTVATAG